MAINDDIADNLRAHAVDLLRYDAGLRRKVRELLDSLESDLINAIWQIDPTGPARIRYQRERLIKLLDFVRETIATGYREIDREMVVELRELAAIEASFAAAAVNRAVKVELIDAALTTEQLRSIVSDVLIQGAPTKEWWGRQREGLIQNFTDQMRQGIAAGESIEQLVNRVRGGADETGVNRPGFMSTSKRHAEALVRSSVQTVANDARLAMYQANSDIIKSLIWTSTLDGRTSFYCIARSGLEYSLDGQPIGHSIPWGGGPGTIHWNCRSTAIPRTKSWPELTGLNIPEPPASTRASMDGAVPEDLSFADWLKRKGDGFQDDLLGPGVAKLWRENKITLQDLVDQRGRPLTLEQLRQRMMN